MGIKFLQKLIDIPKTAIINKRLSKAKYVHLMFNDKFNKPFVDFLNRNFNPEEHLILCKKLFDEFDFPQGKNVIKIKRLKNLDFSKVEKVICHSLFDVDLVDYLYTHKNILKEKAYWMIWGGDLYDAPRDEKNDFVRENFKGYLTNFDEDKLLQKYKIVNNEFHKLNYIFPLNCQILDSVKQTDKTCTIIQINNSCDKSTLEILDVLSKFKDENIKIKTVLSYGCLEYKNEIIEKGKQIFADKFEYLDKILSAQEYANYISENSILILNQNRQQGIGNTIANLYLGNKVFIRGDISTNETLNRMGIHIYNTENISNMDFNAFIEYPQKIDNSKSIRVLIDENEIKKDWHSFFKKVNSNNIELFNLINANKQMQQKILNWRNSINVACNFQLKSIDKDTHKNWIKNLYKENPDTVAFLIRFKTASISEFIGLTYLRNINKLEKKADFGIYIYDEKYRGISVGNTVIKKIIEYARNELELAIINLEVLSNNQNAIKLYEKNGFVFKGEKDNVMQYSLEMNCAS